MFKKRNTDKAYLTYFLTYSLLTLGLTGLKIFAAKSDDCNQLVTMIAHPTLFSVLYCTGFSYSNVHCVKSTVLKKHYQFFMFKYVVIFIYKEVEMCVKSIDFINL